MKKIGLSLVVLVLLGGLPAESVRADKTQADPPVVLTGFGRAVIDGIFSPGEWDKAGCTAFKVNLPGDLPTLALAYAMNDAQNLYVAVLIQRPALDPATSVAIEFDNDHDMGLQREEGDDVIGMAIGQFFPVLFKDQFRTFVEPPCCENCLCGFTDSDHGGTNDMAGAASNNGEYSVFEFSHPLDSLDDSHDFSLKPGDTVGFNFHVRVLDKFNNYADTFYPSDLFQNWLFGDIVINQPMPQDIVDYIAGLPDDSFINNAAQRKNAFEEKLKAINKMIESHHYELAIDKLEQDLRPKGDGCFGGNPNNDWIADCDSQKEFLSLVDILIEYLRSLL